MSGLPVMRVLLVSTFVSEKVRKGYISKRTDITKIHFSKIMQEKFLQEYSISHIFCASDILIDEDQSVLPEGFDMEPQLQNRNYGIWGGRDLRSLSLIEQQNFMDPEYSPIEGESMFAFHIRLKAWLDGLFKKVKNQETILVIATPPVIRALSACILVDDIKNSFSIQHKLDIHPKSLSVFSGRCGKWRILTLSAPF
ncbi:phosphoglycerate mutase [Acetobacter pomorum]|uniref:Phosphoglycerate mutase n=2 Tax=Acetobacter pomorum TaxID=65959 RepID=A0A2G4REC2_9PROT|nr:histidine phosphatase family protein [Acetobacter pomorum]PHY94916.1 phosphoglycerate mutase [Acetobacter pomorum]